MAVSSDAFAQLFIMIFNATNVSVTNNDLQADICTSSSAICVLTSWTILNLHWNLGLGTELRLSLLSGLLKRPAFAAVAVDPSNTCSAQPVKVLQMVHWHGSPYPESLSWALP